MKSNKRSRARRDDECPASLFWGKMNHSLHSSLFLSPPSFLPSPPSFFPFLSPSPSGRAGVGLLPFISPFLSPSPSGRAGVGLLPLHFPPLLRGGPGWGFSLFIFPLSFGEGRGGASPLIKVQLHMQNLVFAHADTGMSALMVLVPVVAADVLQRAVGLNADLVNAQNAATLPLKRRGTLWWRRRTARRLRVGQCEAVFA